MTTKIHPWNLNEAADLFLDADWKYHQLAERYGYHPSTVWQMLSRHPTVKALRKAKKERNALGISTPNRSTETLLSDDQMLRWAEGVSLNSIAEEIGMSIPTTRNRLINHPKYAAFRDTRRKLGGNSKSKVDKAEAARLYLEEKYTIYRLADKYGVTHQRIQQILAKFYPEVLKARRAEKGVRARERAAELTVKREYREATDALYESAVDLYGQGFCLRELRDFYPTLNWGTFNLKLNKRREVDPTFPSERGRDGKSWNWLPRMQAAIESTKSFKDAAALLDLPYGTFMNRVNKMRDRGYLKK